MVSHPNLHPTKRFSRLWIGAIVTAGVFSVIMPLAFLLSIRETQLMSEAALLTAASFAVVPLLVRSREADERLLSASTLMGPMAALMMICFWGLLRELQIPAMDPTFLRLSVFAAFAVFLASVFPSLIRR